jgi:hypothetical protein
MWATMQNTIKNMDLYSPAVWDNDAPGQQMLRLNAQ